MQNDRISMFHSVELRLPYMDYKVVEEVVSHEAQNNSLVFSKNLFTDLLFHKKITAPKTTTSGVACNIAEAFVMGINAIANA